MVSLTGQMYAFFMTIVAGVSVGLLFDCYRVLRAGLQPKRWVSVLCDTLYWAVVTPVVFVILLVANWGELRYYVVLGMGLGVFVYFQIMSSFVLWACVNLYHGMGSFFLALGRLLFSVFVWPFRLVGGLGWGRRGTSFLRGSTGRRHARTPRMRWRIWNPGRLFRS